MMPRAMSTGCQQLDALLAAKVASDAVAPPPGAPAALAAAGMAGARPGVQLGLSLFFWL